VPKGYRVTGVYRNENSRLWRRYSLCRAEMLREATVSPGDGAAGDSLREYDVMTSAASKRLAGFANLEAKCNEWYLFHGTGQAAAAGITASGFKMSLAGGHTGTLYGRGTYFAESVTKADEYAEAGTGGNFTMILTRVLGGRVKYTSENEPDPEALVSSCIEGPFDCVLGDRAKCAGTYREFVVFDSESAYPEYIITYTRR